MFTRRTRGRSEGIPTSSLADIAFLLLVFFLVTTVFPRDRGLPTVLPLDAQDVPASQVVQLQIRPDGSLTVLRGQSVHRQVVAIDDLGRLWRMELERNPDAIAAIRTHPDAPYRLMVDVLDELQGAGASRISLQTLDES